jgi:hypothetical protein
VTIDLNPMFLIKYIVALIADLRQLKKKLFLGMKWQNAKKEKAKIENVQQVVVQLYQFITMIKFVMIAQSIQKK